MTFEADYIPHCLQYILVISLCTIASVCILLTTSAGRKLLRKINDFSRSHPIRFLVFFAIFVNVIAWAGTKPPGPVITEEGIKLTRCEQDAEKVIFEWETDDRRIKPGSVYHIQEYDHDSHGWINIGSTTETAYQFLKFTVHKNHKWRIAVDITEAE